MPLRQCIGCGEMKSKKEMIRVLKTADDTIEIDATGRRNGRGAYLCPSMDCWKKAVKSKGLERSLKMAIQALKRCQDKNITDWNAMKSQVRDSLSSFIYETTKRSPIILPIFLEV